MAKFKFNIDIIVICILIVIIIFGLWYFIAAGSEGQSTVTQTQSMNASSDKSISSFTFAGLNPVVNGVITEANHDIELVVPYGTDVTNLTPTIEVSAGASVSPASGVVQDFTNTVIYKVTGSDNTHQDYTVEVTVADPPVQAITNFTIVNQVGNTVLDQTDHTISLSVPYGTDIANVIPNVTLIAGASMSPTSDIPQDFTNPVTYTVTTADGVQQQYVVTVTVESQSSNPTN